MQDRVVQVERPELRMVEGGRTGASVFDVVTCPQCGEALAGKAEFADELDEFAIGGVGAQRGSQKRDDPGGELVPIAVEHAQFGLEKRCAQHVFTWREKS